MGWSWEGAFSSPDLIPICFVWAALMKPVVSMPNYTALQGALVLLGLLCASGTGTAPAWTCWCLGCPSRNIDVIPAAQPSGSSASSISSFLGRTLRVKGCGRTWLWGSSQEVRAGTFPVGFMGFCGRPALLLLQSCMQPRHPSKFGRVKAPSTCTSCGSNLPWNELLVCKNTAPPVRCLPSPAGCCCSNL